MSKTEAMIGKVKALINAPSCCAEAKEAANKWLEAVNTEKQDEAAKALIEEIAADIIPIDGLIAFAGSEDGKKIFGEERQQESRLTRRRSRQRARDSATVRHAQLLLQS